MGNALRHRPSMEKKCLEQQEENQSSVGSQEEPELGTGLGNEDLVSLFTASDDPESALECTESSEEEAPITDLQDVCTESSEELPFQEPSEDLPPELVAFLSQGPRERRDFQPSTGLGNFGVLYNPETGSMQVFLHLCFEFTEGDPANQDWQGTEGIFPDEYESDENPFQWGESEMESWKAGAIEDIHSFWSDQYDFYCRRPGWEALALVRVQVFVQETRDPKKAHYVVELPRYPLDGQAQDEVTAGNPGTSTLYETGDRPDIYNYDFDEEDLAEGTSDPKKASELLFMGDCNPGEVLFPEGSSEIPGESVADLNVLGGALEMPSAREIEVYVTGEASLDGVGEEAESLPLDRATAVARLLTERHDISTPRVLGDEAAEPGIDHRRAVIDLGKEFQQVTLIHESGHMFGLDDEYPEEEDLRPPGAEPAGASAYKEHMVKRMSPEDQAGIEPFVADLDESVMSSGSEIRPQHYITFLEALQTVTGMLDWDMKPGAANAYEDLAATKPKAQPAEA